MKYAFLFLTSFLLAACGREQPSPPATESPVAQTKTEIDIPVAPELTALESEVNAVLDTVREKLSVTETEPSEETLASELKALDGLVDKYRTEQPEEAAQILYLRARIYVEVLNATGKALQILQRIGKEFPQTQTAESVAEALAMLEERAEAERVQKELIGKTAPPLQFSWSSRDGLKNLQQLRGKVVVLDFWATWCGPCVMTFPQLRELVARYQDYDVEFVGVTSLQGMIVGLTAQPIDTEGDPAKEMRLMRDYIKAKEMTWPVAMSDTNYKRSYGVVSIPHLAMIDADGTVRHTGLHPGMPKEELTEKIDALLKQAGKPAPEI